MESQDGRNTEIKQGLKERQTDGQTSRAECGARNSLAAGQAAAVILVLKPPPQPRTSLQPGRVHDRHYRENWDPPPDERQTVKKCPLPRAKGHRVLKELTLRPPCTWGN